MMKSKGKLVALGKMVISIFYSIMFEITSMDSWGDDVSD